MYQYNSKCKTQSKENTPSTNKSHVQAGIKIPIQTKSLFSPSSNQENDGEQSSSNYDFRLVQHMPLPYSPLQTQLMPKQEQRETQPLPIKMSERQEKLAPISVKSNNTGIPLQMKERIENLSGFSFDDVKVHYNSGKPAQLQALAYTQGNQIYVAMGQEKYLEHELGHVVQQKQGIVHPNVYLNGIPINNDPQLEENATNLTLQRREAADIGVSVAQMGGFEELYEQLFGKPEKKDEIPRIIHRFWAGGLMSAQTITNIINMQQQINEHSVKSTKERPWEQILWTNRQINMSIGNAVEKQLEALKAEGVEIRDSAELAGTVIAEFEGSKGADFEKGHERRIDDSVHDLMKLGPKTYIPLKFYSDTVRLMAIHKYGGIYMDTDIGPGTIDLTQSLYHRDEKSEIPLAGVQVQNTSAYERLQNKKPNAIQNASTIADSKRSFFGQFFSKGVIKPKDMSEKSFHLFLNTFDQFSKDAPVFNYFFASRAQNPKFKSAIEHMLTHPDDSGMGQMQTLFGSTKGFFEWVIPWITELEWATSASNTQESDSVEAHKKGLFPLARPMPHEPQRLQVGGMDYSYDPQEIAMDGNCFFNAVIQYMHFPTAMLRSMRSVAAAAENHTDGIEQNSVWAEREDVSAIANHYNLLLHIHFITDDGVEYQVEQFGPPDGTVVRLALDHRHYSPLRAVPPVIIP